MTTLPAIRNRLDLTGADVRRPIQVQRIPDTTQGWDRFSTSEEVQRALCHFLIWTLPPTGVREALEQLRSIFEFHAATEALPRLSESATGPRFEVELGDPRTSAPFVLDFGEY